MRVLNVLSVIQTQIDKLETAGFKVRLSHRPDECGQARTNNSPTKGTPYHGRSILSISHEYNNTFAVGSGYCSLHDNFSRVRGTKYAFNRAIHSLSSIIGRDCVKRILV